jgi:hypothetical protein
MPVFFLVDGGVPEEAAILALLKLTLAEIELDLGKGSSAFRLMATSDSDDSWGSRDIRTRRGFLLALISVRFHGD